MKRNRICTICGESKPLTIRNYYKLKSTGDAYRNFCIECCTLLEPIRRFRKWQIVKPEKVIKTNLLTQQIITKARELLLNPEITPTDALRTALSLIKKGECHVSSIQNS